MSAPLPPGVEIAPPPPELKLRDKKDSGYYPDWRELIDDDQCDGNRQESLSAATKFPERIETGTPEVLRTKLFACSGSPNSLRYMEPSKFRAIPDMGWEEARIALNRLRVPLYHSYRNRATTRDYVALAEFTLTAHGFEGFAGKKGGHAVKLRKELNEAIVLDLHRHLHEALETAKNHAAVIARPITTRLQGKGWRDNAVLWAMVPTAAARWVEIIEATPDQVIAALDYLRTDWASWQERRPIADRAANRLGTAKPPSAGEYAEAMHIAEMLAFTGEKLSMLYGGIMHSVPIYRLYPAISEREAIAAWWPWGRAVPLMDGAPPRPPRQRKQTLDPAIITATRPQDVVRQVIELTGMNRTTAQRLTANLRARMRSQRQHEAETLLRKGMTKAEVARTVGLSPSRISAMFKGKHLQVRSDVRTMSPG
jgi:hypothetical protein